LRRTPINPDKVVTGFETFTINYLYFSKNQSEVASEERGQFSGRKIKPRKNIHAHQRTTRARIKRYWITSRFIANTFAAEADHPLPSRCWFVIKLEYIYVN
jgi:hypothetical protein